MSIDPQKIIEYERISPLCMQPLVGVMPGFEIITRDEFTLISSVDYPSPDANRASILQASPESIEGILDEIVAYFKERNMPAAIMLSPACTPADLPERLLKRGFARQDPPEAWMVMENLQTIKRPRVDPKITVRRVEAADVPLFAEVMAAAFEMPAEWVPVLINVVAPSVGINGFTHYLAWIGERPLATLTMMRHQDYVVIGSAGVLPEYRGSSTIFSLAVKVVSQAQDEGVNTVLLQTTLGPVFERFLRICGFKPAFWRVGYSLE